MKHFVFDAIVNAATSLAASTCKTLTANGASVRLNGMCSSYRSHRTVEFENAPRAPEGVAVVALENDKYRMVFAPYPLQADNHREFLDPDDICEVHAVQVPENNLWKLSAMAKEYLGVHMPEGLVHVLVPTRRVTGWDGDKRPIFAEPQPKRVELTPEREAPSECAEYVDVASKK